MVLVPVPAFQDNYIWVWHDGTRAIVVDPGEAEGVQAYLTQHGLVLDSILVTHHHGDHTGGVVRLQASTGAQVFAPSAESPELIATRVTHGSQLTLLGNAMPRHACAWPHSRACRLCGGVRARCPHFVLW
jgi:hydroxyacylglutathione hydrolase